LYFFRRCVFRISLNKASVEISHSPVIASKVARCIAPDPNKRINEIETSARGFTKPELNAITRRRFSRLILV
jgi:hypothetical protein